MKAYDKIFKSTETKEQKYQLASGYISTTTVFLEEERVAARIEAKGDIVFYDETDAELAKIQMAEQTGGRGVYEDVICSVEDDNIILKFPVVEWIDNYPHCDGEHDRWDSRIIGWHVLRFDIRTKAFTVENHDK